MNYLHNLNDFGLISKLNLYHIKSYYFIINIIVVFQLFILSVVSKYKINIIHAMVEDSDWKWRIIYLLSFCLHLIKSLPTNFEKKMPAILKIMRGFLDPDVYAEYEPCKDTSDLLTTVSFLLLNFFILVEFSIFISSI